MPSEVGLADLRQRASDIVRRTEAGEEFVVTVSGRAAALLSPIPGDQWVNASDVELLLANLSSWGDRSRPDLDESLSDPWQK